MGEERNRSECQCRALAAVIRRTDHLDFITFRTGCLDAKMQIVGSLEGLVAAVRDGMVEHGKSKQ
jgi:hypothetical protein